MTPEEKAAKDMLFIAPYDYEGLAGWLVRISWYPDANYENRKWHSKLFAFRDFASNDDALAAARSYRDKWIEENKGKRYLRSIGARFSPTLPRNNTSGIVGVNRSEKRKKSGPLWQTTYPAPEGCVVNKKFPISIYGEVGALRLAIEARRAGLLTALGNRNIATDEAAIKGARLELICYDGYMPRRPRIHLDGVPLHIVQRGHNREPCFFGEEDYQAYLYWLGEALKKEHCALHAYALMTNHVHLLVTPARADAIPRLIIALGRRYVQYINTTYRRTGTLWDSRYKSSLIQAETYLLSCQRYIELNPVRAAMVDDPAHYRWTSYRHNALGQPNSYLTPHPLYLSIGRDDPERQAAYRDLFRAQLDSKAIDDIRLALNQNQPLGNSRFYAKIEATTGQRREARARGRPPVQRDESPAHDAGQGELGL